MIQVRTKLVLPWHRKARPRRGTQRLLTDLATLHRLADAPRPSAQTRLEAAIGSELASELARQLSVRTERRRRSGLRRAA